MVTVEQPRIETGADYPNIFTPEVVRESVNALIYGNLSRAVVWLDEGVNEEGHQYRAAKMTALVGSLFASVATLVPHDNNNAPFKDDDYKPQQRSTLLGVSYGTPLLVSVTRYIRHGNPADVMHMLKIHDGKQTVQFSPAGDRSPLSLREQGGIARRLGIQTGFR